MKPRFTFLHKLFLLTLFISIGCESLRDATAASPANSSVTKEVGTNICSTNTKPEDCSTSPCLWCNGKCISNEPPADTDKCSGGKSASFSFFELFSWFKIPYYVKVIFWVLVGLVVFCILFRIFRMFCCLECC